MRIVVKIGSTLITGNQGVNHIFLQQLASKILAQKEHSFAVVTSGAIATGMVKMGVREKPKGVVMLQALAAIGQSDLIKAYEGAFDERKILAQVLLTNHDFSDRMRYLNIRNTLNMILTKSIIPIINENDTVTVMDIKKAAFGDNDTLAAHVATAIDSDLLIILTNVEGLYDRNPEEKGAKLIRKIEQITDKELDMCNGKTALGRGGMATKLQAAKIASEAGIKVVVCNGNCPDYLNAAISEKIGTSFLPMREGAKLSEKKHWIMFASEPKGKIKVNENAMKCAIGKNCGITPDGVLEVEGQFEKGAVIEVADSEGNVLCKGITNYFSFELEKIKGKNHNEIEKILGFVYEEVISGSDMVVAG
ncbi:glutamate 5-kinase [Candidatus Micrarchaeota archaeon]|nr:glutamate 5-kinase [Candidatus Micrarchaeota archaeon]